MDTALEEFERRERTISLLMTQSESRLDAFFFSLGLAEDFRAPGAGWGRQKRIVSALAASEQRGDISRVLDLVNRTFTVTTPADSTVDTTEFRPSGDMAPQASQAVQVPEYRPSADPGRTGSPTIDDSVTSVFVVHGHNVTLKEQVARLVERIGAGRLEAIILAEQNNRGLTIIEKFETYASAAGFAIVLLTPDDLGGVAAGAGMSPRGRQNVILELGYFIGSLGRGRIAVLVQGDIEIPSDIAGVLYIRADDAGAWKHQLAREMSAAGLPIDYSRIA